MKCIIIGAGAAGMMVAATLLEEGGNVDILIFEKNAYIGKKVAISGGGRCNVTSGIDNVRTLITKYPRGGKFLTSALYSFGPQQIQEWFEQHGVPLKTEEDMRVFPASDRGQDIVDVFERLFHNARVQMHLSVGVKSIEPSGKGYRVYTATASYDADVVVLALGGQAYRHTGSTGDGYALAERCGHHITALAPSLNAFICAETWISDLAGISFDSVRLSATSGETKWHSEGPCVFTHRGLSGPAVFALSAQVAFVQYTKATPLTLFIDCCPLYPMEELVQQLKRYCEEHPKQLFKQAVRQFVPLRCVEVFGKAFHMAIDTPCAEVSNQHIRYTAETLKEIVMHAVSRAAGEEFVTAGGIELSEVHPKTGESLISAGLYFAGEILNIDGYTGGFNLTASWAMGRAVGLAIAETSRTLQKE